jgi:hypothetical protein
VSKHDPRGEAMMFRPFALTKKLKPNRPWTKRESFLVKDLTMEHQDWSKYDSPAKDRFKSKRPPRPAREGKISKISRIPSFLKRQAD